MSFFDALSRLPNAVSSWIVGGAVAPRGAAAALPAPPSPAKVEWQLIMRCCDRTSLLRLARCNRDCWAAASEAFAWGVLSDRIEWFTIKHNATIAGTFVRAMEALWGDTQSRSSATLGARLDKSLLRNCDVGIHVVCPQHYDDTTLQSLLHSIPRLRGLDMDGLESRLENKSGFNLPRLRELRGNSPLAPQHIVILTATQPELCILDFSIRRGERMTRMQVENCSFPAIHTVRVQKKSTCLLGSMSLLFPNMVRFEITASQMNVLCVEYWIPNKMVFPRVCIVCIDVNASRGRLNMNANDMHLVFPMLHTLKLYPTGYAIMQNSAGLENFIETMASRTLPSVPVVIEMHWPRDETPLEKTPYRERFDALQRAYPGRFRLM